MIVEQKLTSDRDGLETEVMFRFKHVQTSMTGVVHIYITKSKILCQGHSDIAGTRMGIWLWENVIQPVLTRTEMQKPMEINAVSSSLNDHKVPKTADGRFKKVENSRGKTKKSATNTSLRKFLTSTESSKTVLQYDLNDSSPGLRRILPGTSKVIVDDPDDDTVEKRAAKARHRVRPKVGTSGGACRYPSDDEVFKQTSEGNEGKKDEVKVQEKKKDDDTDKTPPKNLRGPVGNQTKIAGITVSGGRNSETDVSPDGGRKLSLKNPLTPLAQYRMPHTPDISVPLLPNFSPNHPSMTRTLLEEIRRAKRESCNDDDTVSDDENGTEMKDNNKSPTEPEPEKGAEPEKEKSTLTPDMTTPLVDMRHKPSSRSPGLQPPTKRLRLTSATVDNADFNQGTNEEPIESRFVSDDYTGTGKLWLVEVPHDLCQRFKGLYETFTVGSAEIQVHLCGTRRNENGVTIITIIEMLIPQQSGSLHECKITDPNFIKNIDSRYHVGQLHIHPDGSGGYLSGVDCHTCAFFERMVGAPFVSGVYDPIQNKYSFMRIKEAKREAVLKCRELSKKAKAPHHPHPDAWATVPAREIAMKITMVDLRGGTKQKKNQPIGADLIGLFDPLPTEGNIRDMAGNKWTPLSRKGLLEAHGVARSAASVGRRAMAVDSRRIPRSFRSHLVAGRTFATATTDESNGETAPPPVSASAMEIIDDEDVDEPSDDSPSEVEDVDYVASAVSDASETFSNELNKNLKPSEIVEALDRHIVGQPDAKKSVAIAMRNRWRRRQLPEDLRKEVTPRNVLLVGPTG